MYPEKPLGRETDCRSHTIRIQRITFAALVAGSNCYHCDNFAVPDRGAHGELHILTRYTSGLMAVNTVTPLTIMLCFFLMFTTADSLHRETTTGLSPLYFSTPAHTSAIVIGKDSC